MDKTIKINLAGTLFQIDEAAYYILRDYLQAIDRHFHNLPGGNETIEDIESRISEIFRTQQNMGVISKENVEAMIGIIGNPDDFDHQESPQQPRETTTSRRRLYRNPEDSIIGGVCGGIGAYVNIDPVWVRLAFIVTALFFGTGIFIYLALWISIPKAQSDIQMKELYGNNYNYKTRGPDQNQKSGGSYSYVIQGEDSVSRVGGAFNEVFRALGKFFFVVFRIIMIIFGIFFVITGFSLMVLFIVGFFFKYPGVIHIGDLNGNLFYLPDLLNCVVSPALTPWIVVLAIIAVILPLTALVYWGIKMIFWFRANDGVISLIFLIIWVLSITALSIILFNEGVSFSQEGRSISQEIFLTPPDTLHIVTGKKVQDMAVKKEISLPDNHYSLFIGAPDDKLSVRARLSLSLTDDKVSKAEIRKKSFGRTKIDATKKAESLIYDCRIKKDSLILDEYFTIPSGGKWSGDELRVNLYLPEKTVLHFDKASENLFTNRVYLIKTDKDGETMYDIDSDTESWQLGDKYWILTNEGLRETERAKPIKK